MKLQKEFNQYLADLAVMTFKLHNLHWNVTGSQFVPVHEFTEALYDKLFEYFDVGNDLVIYEDMKDMVMKVMYYLKYDEKRIRIAENGHRKVCEKFSFDDRLKTLLEI